MNKTQTTCDYCSDDITYTSNCVDYIIEVRSIEKRKPEGFSTSMMKYPPIPNPLHFCGTDCLKHYILKELQ